MADPPSTQTSIRGAQRCRVMINYAGGFDKYGLFFGLHQPNQKLPPVPPASPFIPINPQEQMGVQDWLFASDPLLGPPVGPGPFEQNLTILRNQFGVSHVRFFLMCNAINWGIGDPSGVFTVPPFLHPRFVAHFQEILRVCQRTGVQLIPSLLDFGIAEPRLKTSRRNAIVADPSVTKFFFDQVFEPLLDESFNTPGVVFAWEIMNEPIWLTTNFWPWFEEVTIDIPVPVLARTPIGAAPTVQNVRKKFPKPVLNDSTIPMKDVERFLLEGISRVDKRNAALPAGSPSRIPTTVGHRFFENMLSLPTGDLPQFHFYPTRKVGVEVSESSSSLFSPFQANGAFHVRNDGKVLNPPPFLGEFGSTADQSSPWKDLKGFDEPTDRDRVRERLYEAERLGFSMAGVWPSSGGTRVKGSNPDPLHFSSDALEGIRDYQLGKHPKGKVPR